MRCVGGGRPPSVILGAAHGRRGWQRGYRVELLAMEPLTASPKNDVLVAVPGTSTRRLPAAGVDDRPTNVWLGALAAVAPAAGTAAAQSQELPAPQHGGAELVVTAQ